MTGEKIWEIAKYMIGEKLRDNSKPPTHPITHTLSSAGGFTVAVHLGYVVKHLWHHIYLLVWGQVL